MKLHSNPASPFGRKVKVIAHEKGLIDRISLHVLQTTAVGPDLGLVADNPLGESCHYPDSKKWLVRSPERRLFRGDSVDYYDEEE